MFVERIFQKLKNLKLINTDMRGKISAQNLLKLNQKLLDNQISMKTVLETKKSNIFSTKNKTSLNWVNLT